MSHYSLKTLSCNDFRELEMLINCREEKMKHVDGIQMEINQLYEDIRQIEMQLLEYKKQEQITRSTLKSMVNIDTSYWYIVGRLFS